MVPEIKLVISQNNKKINSLTQEIKPQHLTKSLERFQLAANAALTKMIEEIGDSDDFNIEEDGSSDSEEEEDTAISPKKRKR